MISRQQQQQHRVSMLKSKKEGFLSIIQKEKRKMAYPLFMSNEKREVGFRLCTTYGIGKELACAADKFVQFCGSAVLF